MQSHTQSQRTRDEQLNTRLGVNRSIVTPHLVAECQRCKRLAIVQVCCRPQAPLGVCVLDCTLLIRGLSTGPCKVFEDSVCLSIAEFDPINCAHFVCTWMCIPNGIFYEKTKFNWDSYGKGVHASSHY